MTKFVISDEGRVAAIVNTRADAEEFVLSLAEEEIYEEYVCGLLLHWDIPYKEFCKRYRTRLRAVNRYREQGAEYGWRTFQTLYGYMLTKSGEDYSIREAVYLDD